jgi:TolA-binding protein
LPKAAGHTIEAAAERSGSVLSRAEPAVVEPPLHDRTGPIKVGARSNGKSETTRRHRLAVIRGDVVARPSVAAAAADPADILGDEATLLERGMRQLHQDRDPDAAIALMSEYVGRYPKGALLAEARLTLVEALLARGRASDALKVLADVELQDSMRGRELLALRGELLAEADRCSEALTDFATVMRGERGDLAEERARIGTARCRALHGDVAGARDELLRYLVRFPKGRFAGTARSELGQ